MYSHSNLKQTPTLYCSAHVTSLKQLKHRQLKNLWQQPAELQFFFYSKDSENKISTVQGSIAKPFQGQLSSETFVVESHCFKRVATTLIHNIGTS
jgi:hypothetical protein